MPVRSAECIVFRYLSGHGGLEIRLGTDNLPYRKLQEATGRANLAPNAKVTYRPGLSTRFGLRGPTKESRGLGPLCPLQVIGGIPEPSRIVMEASDAPVADRAENPSDLAGGVVVIHDASALAFKD